MKKMKPERLILIITLMLSLCVMQTLRAAKEPRSISAPDSGDAYKSISLFMRVIQILRGNYIEKDKVTYDKLICGAMKGMLRELDPFSAYEPPDRYKKTIERNKGSFGGIGIIVTNKNRVLEVISPLDDTPGYKAGIHSGDIITRIEGEPTTNMSLADCVKRLKGPPGTPVRITIYRKSDDMTKEFTVKRAKIKVSAVKGPEFIDNNIAYIRIIQFTAPVALQLDKALEDVRKHGAGGLILDLRGNPGGLFSAALEVASRFLKKGEVVASTQGRGEKNRKEFKTLPCDKFTDIPMVVLVNSTSASASEIVAGCLRDHKRAVLVGSRTFGKAFIQTILPLSNKGALRFTTGKYYTPGGFLIHGQGIQPDINIQFSDKNAMKIAYQSAAFPGKIKPPGKGYIKDVQLERAVEILKGINIYARAVNDD